jgi:glycosyltransferase involved in cell wall biosynthesis
MRGGVGAYTQELAVALAQDGHEVHVITHRKARPAEAKRRFWEPREPQELDFGLLHARVHRWWWSSVGIVAEIVNGYDLDIINIQYQAAAFDMRVPAINLLPWRLKNLCQCVVTYHDLRVPYLFPKAGGLRRWVINKMASSADGVIVTNSQDYKALTGIVRDDGSLIKIPIGSNIQADQPNPGVVKALRHDFALKPSDYLIGYFGFVTEGKGADLLINALEQLGNQYHLAFIGAVTRNAEDQKEQAFVKKQKELISKKGLSGRVHWTGFLNDTQVSAYLHAADLMVMPYRDGVSLRRGTLMAIMAHGRPLITTESNFPILELGHGQNVWLTPVDDHRHLKDAIVELMDNSELREKLSNGALELASLFTWDTIAAKTAEFFRLLSGALS